MLEIAKKFFAPYRLYLLLGPAAKIVEVIFDLLTPLVIAYMIDAGVLHHDMTPIIQGALYLLSFAGAGILFTLITQKMASLTSQGIGTALRRALFARINTLSYNQLDTFGTSGLVTRITNDVNQVQLAVAMLIRQVIRWPILAVGSLVCALLINWQLGLIFCVCLPLVGLLFALVMRRQVYFFKKAQTGLDRVGGLVREMLSGVRVIRALDRKSYEEERFCTASAHLAKHATRAANLSVCLNPLTFLVINSAICIILWQGAHLVGAGDLYAGQIMAFIGYMNQLLISIGYVANLVVIFTRAEASAQRINSVLDTENDTIERASSEHDVAKSDRDIRSGLLLSTPKKTSNAQALASRSSLAPSSNPSLVFDHVSYTYPNAQASALSDISFTLEEGESLGIIGGTGSGKTTLANLIAGMLEVTSGTILVEGLPTSAYGAQELHGYMGVVPQKSLLLSGLLRENLVWRKPDATDAEIWDALRVAQAKDFVEKKEKGLFTQVERAGRNFSGGQRQRLCIARALLGNPRLLVLDDASSALDFATEAALRQSLSELRHNPAMIFISQRVSSVRFATHILVLEKGKLAGYGTHDELLKTCSVYRQICETQLAEEELLDE